MSEQNLSNIPTFKHSKFQLLIFDCDGTLVDSEYLNNKAFSDVLTGFGLEKYTPDYCTANFVGRTISNLMLEIQMETGFDFPADTVQRYISRVEALQQIELYPVKGALDFVRLCAEQLPVCVGSNGERRNVLRSLELTGFSPYFPEERVFTKIQVKEGKPAPDLFLFAADQMGVSPDRCVVIEDSVTGVTAGVAAGMVTIGFTGTHHEPEKQAIGLKSAGAHAVAGDLIHIKSLIGL